MASDVPGITSREYEMMAALCMDPQFTRLKGDLKKNQKIIYKIAQNISPSFF